MFGRFRRKEAVPIVLFAIGILLLFAYQLTRSGTDFVKDSFQDSQNYSAESAVVIGGERPAEVILPTNYSQETPVPLLIDLHGYTGDSISQSAYTFLQGAADQRGVAYVAPNGMKDSSGSGYWNATDACCNFGGSKVSDVDYIKSLIEEITSKVSIDQSRIYLFGHSNGHFMSYKFVCSTESIVTAIAGLAGAMDSQPQACNKKPMNILHIHGTSDATISYEGGAILGNSYPSVKETVAQWASINSCTSPREVDLELLSSMQGIETSQISYTCSDKSLELWRINGGVHVPILDKDFALRTLDWLLSHRK